MKFLRNLDLASFFKLTTRERFDRITPVCILLLSLFGVFFIYSAQFAREGTQWRGQLVFLSLGAVIYLATALLDYRIWLRYAHWVYLAGLVLLVRRSRLGRILRALALPYAHHRDYRAEWRL